MAEEKKIYIEEFKKLSSKKLVRLVKITINVGAGFVYAAAGIWFIGGVAYEWLVMSCMFIGLLWVAFGTGVVWADSIVFPRTRPSLLQRFLEKLRESNEREAK